MEWSKYFKSIYNTLGVVTNNLVRLAMIATKKEKDINKARELFIEQYIDNFNMSCRINNCKRKLIKERIELNSAPLYSLNLMNLN